MIYFPKQIVVLGSAAYGLLVFAFIFASGVHHYGAADRISAEFFALVLSVLAAFYWLVSAIVTFTKPHDFIILAIANAFAAECAVGAAGYAATPEAVRMLLEFFDGFPFGL